MRRIALVAVVAVVALAACTPIVPPPAASTPPKPSGPPNAVLDVPVPGVPRTEVAGARWADKLVVAGGIAPVGASFVGSRALFFFNLKTKSWSTGPALPGPRDHASLAVLNGSLYLVGGFSDTLKTATAEVWRLDAPNGSWVPVAPLTMPRGALATVSVSGYLVAIGGHDDVVSHLDQSSTEWYDPATDTWTAGPAMSITRQHLGAAAAGTTVYAIAGRPPNRRSVEKLTVLPGTGPTGGWTAAPALSFSRGGNGASATAGGVPCTGGGEEAAGTIASIECLVGGRWQHVANLKVPRHGLAVIGERGRIHFISGGPQPGATYSSTHEHFDP